MEAIATIEPWPDFSRKGRAASAAVTICMTSTSNPLRKSSGVLVGASALALATKTSRPPSPAAPSLIQAASALGSATSTPRENTVAPLALRARAVSSIWAASRAQRAIAAPSAAKRSAMARPMPRLEPVMKTLRPRKPRSMGPSDIGHMNLRAAVAPGHGALQLCTQLHADGKPVRMHSQRQRYGRLAGDVVGHQELLIALFIRHELERRQIDIHVEHAEPGAGLRRGRRQPDVEVRKE